MKDLKGTKTAENLMKAFAGESQARNRYTFYASKAKSEGHPVIANHFLETAAQEKEHAEIFFKFLSKQLNGEPIEIHAPYPVALYPDTISCLRAAAEGEHEEWADLYPEFARVAKEEGFPEISAAFALIATVEKEHEEKYRFFHDRLESDTLYTREEEVYWVCTNCGYVSKGKQAPARCPACDHSRGYFQVKVDFE